MASILKVNEIQHTGGTSALTVDSSGNVDFPQKVTTPNRVAFLAPAQNAASRDISSFTIFPGSYYSTGVSNYFNNGNHWNTTTGKFIAPFDGLYYFSGQQRFDGYGGSNYVYLRLQLFDTDGSTVLRSLSTSLWDGNFTYRCFTVDTLCNLTVGQQVGLGAMAVGDTTIGWDDGHFLGYHIG